MLAFSTTAAALLVCERSWLILWVAAHRNGPDRRPPWTPLFLPVPAVSVLYCSALLVHSISRSLWISMCFWNATGDSVQSFGDYVEGVISSLGLPECLICPVYSDWGKQLSFNISVTLLSKLKWESIRFTCWRILGLSSGPRTDKPTEEYYLMLCYYILFYPAVIFWIIKYQAAIVTSSVAKFV